MALKSEAQAFVDKYKLHKMKLAGYTLYYDALHKIIISGVGLNKAREATQTLINHYDISDEDYYLNIGICASKADFDIGSLLEIGTITYKNTRYPLKEKKHTISCVDEPLSTPEYELVDMESYGFYDAVIHSPAIKNIYIFKIVSDHFQPHLVTKEKTKLLIFNVINDINKQLFTQGKLP